MVFYSCRLNTGEELHTCSLGLCLYYIIPTYAYLTRVPLVVQDTSGHLGESGVSLVGRLDGGNLGG